MSAEFEPVAKPDAAAGAVSASGAAPEPGPTQTPQPDKNLDRELAATSRSARYAVVAAVSAAVISSFVSAGAAVYVNINQADRRDQQAVTNAVRADREKIYTDFSVALTNYGQQLGAIRGRLMAHQPVDAIRSSITDFGQGFAELDRAANLLLMAGSPGMEEVATRILETHSSFWNDRVQPFITRCLQLPNAPGSNDTVGWEKDSAALGSAIGDLLNKLGDLNASFVNQGIKDLQILR